MITDIDVERVHQILDDIGSMIGMATVKKEVSDLVAQGVFNRKAEAQGMTVTNDTKHMLFVGDPGTGKTEIAKKIAPLYKALGLVPKGQFVAPKHSELIGRHLGDTQAMVKEQFDKARGGVLFIDEAYGLVHGEQDIYGYQAIETLLDLMEQHRDDTVVILAGYPDEMADLLATNPGLESRFSRTINFPKYSQRDLFKIAGKFFNDAGFQVERGSEKPIKEAILAHSQGNARNVRNIVRAIQQAHAVNTAYEEDADVRFITVQDVQDGIQRYTETRPPRRKAG